MGKHGSTREVFDKIDQREKRRRRKKTSGQSPENPSGQSPENPGAPSYRPGVDAPLTPNVYGEAPGWSVSGITDSMGQVAMAAPITNISSQAYQPIYQQNYFQATPDYAGGSQWSGALSGLSTTQENYFQPNYRLTGGSGVILGEVDDDVDLNKFPLPDFAAPPRIELKPGDELSDGFRVNDDGHIEGKRETRKGSDHWAPRSIFYRTEEFRPLNPDGSGDERLYRKTYPRGGKKEIYVDAKLKVHPYTHELAPKRLKKQTYHFVDEDTVESTNGTQFKHIGDWYQKSKAFARVNSKTKVPERVFSFVFQYERDQTLSRSAQISVYDLEKTPQERVAPPEYGRSHNTPSPPELTSKRHKGKGHGY